MFFKILNILFLFFTLSISTDNSYIGRTIIGNRSYIPANWYKLERINSNDKMNFIIALKQHNIDYIEDILINISNPKNPQYGEYKTRNEILDIIVPDIKYSESILDWIHTNNNNFDCINGFDYIKCNSNVKNVEKLFLTNIYSFYNNYTNKIINIASSYSVPSYLNNYIHFILGLADIPFYNNVTILKNNTYDNDAYISAYGLHKMYNMTWNNKTLSNSSQAVAEFQNDQCINLQDLQYFEKVNSLSNSTLLKKNIIGTCDLNTSNPDVEASLDLQFQIAMNPSVNQMYVSVEEWQYDFAITLFNLKNPPLVNSISWGWAESQQCDESVFPECYINVIPEIYSKRVNIEFMKLSLRGVTLISSSGDAGAPSRINEYCSDNNTSPLNPIFPTSSPWVTSVGGNIVTKPIVLPPSNTFPDICKNYSCIIGGTEENCNFDRCQWTSGGGFSNFFNRPWWQVDAIDNYLNSSKNLPPQKFFNRFGRAYPDVSLVAHNYLVEVAGYIQIVDGTSASAPTFSGMISRINNLRIQNKKPSFGALNPLLYQMASECPLCFKDITVGSNNSTEADNCTYGYSASKGYDPVYGLGTPNYGNIENYILKL